MNDSTGKCYTGPNGIKHNHLLFTAWRFKMQAPGTWGRTMQDSTHTLPDGKEVKAIDEHLGDVLTQLLFGLEGLENTLMGDGTKGNTRE